MKKCFENAKLNTMAIVPVKTLKTRRKRQKIDWDNIPIKVVPADPKNPNPLNPCSKMTQEEREEEIIAICGRIWAKVMEEK